ncbi:MAG: alpha/beta fold hydrolase [Anaerolineae bacterium]
MHGKSLSIAGLRDRPYGARLSLVKALHVQGKPFRSFVLTYMSDGLKVFARLNVPRAEPPAAGFPVIVFAHGFSPQPLDPDYFQRPYYERWTDAYAEAGFVVIAPGYRGHGIVNGETADGAEVRERYAELHLTSPFYAIDVLNLVASLPTLAEIDWGDCGPSAPPQPLVDERTLYLVAHSMGGDVALIVLTVTKRVQAASIWAGVCADIRDVTRFYAAHEGSRTPAAPTVEAKLAAIASTVAAEPFCVADAAALNGYYSLADLSTPLVIHQGTRDPAIPTEWCLNLHAELARLGKTSRLYLYEGNDHELSLNDAHETAVQRDIAFFCAHAPSDQRRHR